MAKIVTCSEKETPPFPFNVTFIVNKTAERRIRSSDSDYLARNFMNKLKHSKRCTFVSYSKEAF